MAEETVKSAKKPRTKSEKGKRKQIDPIFKELISLCFTGRAASEFALSPGLQVGQTQLEIDVAIQAAETLSQAEITELLKNTPLYFLTHLNCVEFKSVNDPLEFHDLYRVYARALLAAAQYYQRLAEEQGRGQQPGRKKGKKESLEGRVTSCIISAAYPAALQEQLRVPFKPIKGAPTGFYYRPYLDEIFIPSFLIVCNQLPLDEKFYPLLVFAEGNKLESFIERVIDLDLQLYVKYLVRLQAEKVAEVVSKTGRGEIMTAAERRGYSAVLEALASYVERLDTSRMSQEDRERCERIMSAMRKRLGEKEFLRFAGETVSPETTVEIVGTEEAAKQLGRDKLVEMLSMVDPNITAAEIEKLIKERNEKAEK